MIAINQEEADQDAADGHARSGVCIFRKRLASANSSVTGEMFT